MTTVHVAVGVIVDDSRQVLVTQRSAQQHLGGYWEFPGGKVEPDESVQQSLARELKEELGIDIVAQATRPLCMVEHDYGDKQVILDVWQINRYRGTPSGLEGQPLRWVAMDELQADQFPAANRTIIRNIQLPEQIAIVNLTPEHVAAPPLIGADASTTLPLIRLRAAWPALTANDLTVNQRYQVGEAYLQAAETCLEALTRQGHRALLDLAPLLAHPTTLLPHLVERFSAFKGMHCNRWLLPDNNHNSGPDQATLTAWLHELRRHDHLLAGASCHNRDELAAASKMGADFALLSPVKATGSHPDAVTLGWSGFQQHVASSRLPVYALGGMRAADLTAARQAGGRGIAGVSLFQAPRTSTPVATPLSRGPADRALSCDTKR